MSDYIPLDLLSIVLARLSVDDAVRCTSVCKSWYDFITSSSFISLHLKKSPANQESRLLIKSFVRGSDGVNKCCKIHRDNLTFDEIAELECPFKGVFQVIGSINGLLCLCIHSSKRMYVWNPSLRKSVSLPDSWLNNSINYRFGFGFLPDTNDYKIVRLLLTNRYTDFIQVDVYDLSTNSSRSVCVGEVSYLPVNSNAAVFLEGSLHWGVKIFHDNDSGKIGRSIVSFNLKNEKVSALVLPSSLDNDLSNFDVSAVKESLCLIVRRGVYRDIWVMNEYGVSDSWTMKFRIYEEADSLMRFLHFRENGEVILEKMPSMFLRRLVSYDPTSNQVVNLGEFVKNTEYRVATYMESLTLIKSANQVFEDDSEMIMSRLQK